MNSRMEKRCADSTPLWLFMTVSVAAAAVSAAGFGFRAANTFLTALLRSVNIQSRQAYNQNHHRNNDDIFHFHLLFPAGQSILTL